MKDIFIGLISGGVGSIFILLVLLCIGAVIEVYVKRRKYAEQDRRIEIAEKGRNMPSASEVDKLRALEGKKVGEPNEA